MPGLSGWVTCARCGVLYTSDAGHICVSSPTLIPAYDQRVFTPDDVHQRIAALEARVAELEARLNMPPDEIMRTVAEAMRFR